MSKRLKGKALAQTDPHRKPKKNRHMIPKRIITHKTSAETRVGVYGEGIIFGAFVGLVMWIVVWIAFC